MSHVKTLVALLVGAVVFAALLALEQLARFGHVRW